MDRGELSLAFLWSAIDSGVYSTIVRHEACVSDGSYTYGDKSLAVLQRCRNLARSCEQRGAQSHITHDAIAVTPSQNNFCTGADASHCHWTSSVYIPLVESAVYQVERVDSGADLVNRPVTNNVYAQMSVLLVIYSQLYPSQPTEEEWGLHWHLRDNLLNLQKASLPYRHHTFVVCAMHLWCHVSMWAMFSDTALYVAKGRGVVRTQTMPGHGIGTLCVLLTWLVILTNSMTVERTDQWSVKN